MTRHRIRRLPAAPAIARRPARLGCRAALAAAPLALALTAGLAPTASAADYCLADADCVAGGGQAVTSVQQAFALARSSAAADRLQIGAGTFDVSAAGAAPLYDGASPLEVAGRGAKETRLTQSIFGPPNYPATLELHGDVRVRDLGLLTGDGTGGRGLVLHGGHAERVTVYDPIGATSGLGVVARGARLTEVVSELDGDESTAIALGDLGGVPAAMEGGRAGAALGTALSSDSEANAPAIRIHGARLGGRSAFTLGRGRAHLDSTLLRATAPGYPAVRVENFNALKGELRAILRHVTIAGDGDAGQQGVRVVSRTSGQEASAKLIDSIVSGVERPLVREVSNGGKASIQTDHVNHGPVDPLDNPSVGGGGSLLEVEWTAHDPQFVDPARFDYRLRPGSALIDAGRPDGFDLEEPVADLLGAARIQDGDDDGVARRDLGAWELPDPTPPQPTCEATGTCPPAPPVCPAPAGASAGAAACPPPPACPAAADCSKPPTADRRAPRLTRAAIVPGRPRARRAAQRRTRLVARLDEAARLTVTVKRGKRTVKTLTMKASAGRVTVALPARLRAGRHTVTVTARDAAGNAGRAVRLTFVK